ncbi:PEP-CTERM sorting domain-containing protein [Alienimonas californiensis]|uniref:PEP-CTERM sorting domain-containing protein n=1 Tax=Alienimonas californiensis TaxID=2527989 RepID=UPI0011A14F36|nr:PEP-CTERM sorting domain-containing protein [Alienimonas californiensis]
MISLLKMTVLAAIAVIGFAGSASAAMSTTGPISLTFSGNPGTADDVVTSLTLNNPKAGSLATLTLTLFGDFGLQSFAAGDPEFASITFGGVSLGNILNSVTTDDGFTFNTANDVGVDGTNVGTASIFIGSPFSSGGTFALIFEFGDRVNQIPGGGDFVQAQIDYQQESVEGSAVPEPASLALLGLTACGMVFGGRRRKQIPSAV